jgi:hypothetical protein
MKKVKRASKKTAPKKKGFFVTGSRGARGVERTPLHVLITPAQRAKLVKLSHGRKITCADLVRLLIDAAKL